MSAKKEKNEIPSDKLALYDELIQTNPAVERKGVKLPYTSFNGHMFTFLSETGALAIRLPKNERETFLKKYNTALMESHGAIMKEYVAVPEGLLKNINELKKYLDLSYEYVKTLKPRTQKKVKRKSAKAELGKKDQSQRRRFTMTENIAINGKASKTKSAFRMEYSAGINIKAKPERVWALMTNAADFPRWNSTVKSIEGKIASGQTIKLVAAISPDRVFNLNIIEFVPQKRMVWSDGNALFKGVRTYALNPKADGSTDFTMSEVYTGLMLPMIAGSLPDFGPTFEQYLADLKREAERT